MDASQDLGVREVLRRDVPQVKRPAIANLHVEHLIEVTIINLTAVTHTQRRAAHQAIHRCRIEAARQQFKILVPFPLLPQILGEARDGLIGNRKSLWNTMPNSRPSSESFGENWCIERLARML